MRQTDIHRILRLEGDDALTFNEGNADSTITFSGEIKEDGNIVYSKGGIENQTFVFSGSTDVWRGNFKASGEGGSETVKFTGDSKNIEASVENRGSSKMTVDIDNDEDIRMGGDIMNSGTGETHIVMQGEGMKSMKGNIYATSLEVNGGTVQLESGDYDINTVTVNSGVLRFCLESKDTANLTQLIICSGAGLVAYDYSVTNGSITVQEYGSLSLMDSAWWGGFRPFLRWLAEDERQFPYTGECNLGIVCNGRI